MIEVHFMEPQLSRCREWIQKNRGNFSVLIHIDSGLDDVKDHTENIEWLGEPVKLDFEFFELIKTRPDLKVHQD
jgi:aromatic ring-cleaving dioxygenase